MSNSAEGSGATRRQSREGTGGYDYSQQAGTYEQGRLRVGVGIGRGLAGFLLILNGLYGFFVGLAAIIHGGFFSVVHNNYAYHWSIHGWGWLQLIIGCVLFAAGVCVLLGMVWARVLGAILAGFSAISSFLFLPYPHWSIVVIAVDIFIVWALVSSGRRQPA
jgi:hypothetical protein